MGIIITSLVPDKVKKYVLNMESRARGIESSQYPLWVTTDLFDYYATDGANTLEDKTKIYLFDLEFDRMNTEATQRRTT